MLTGATYEEITSGFRWCLPEYYNIGVDVCDKWAGKSNRQALIQVGPDGREQRYTFRDLKNWSNRLANTLQANGIRRSDRVAILLPQRVETLLSHIAVYKCGAIAVPMLTLFGPEAIQYRLEDCGAKAVITDSDNISKVLDIGGQLATLQLTLTVDSAAVGNGMGFWDGLEKGSRRFTPVKTRPDDPAVIIYTSGTTGPPKGTLHAHRMLLGILPGFEYYHNLFPRKGDLMYSPLDWAYIGGSFDSLFPALHHGVPVLAFRPPKFDPQQVFSVMTRYGVRNLMVVPTVLRIMMNAIANPRQYGLRLRSVTAGGETLGEELYQWSKTALGVNLNEHYGQTECDLVLGFCSRIMDIVPGAIGKAVPGHTVEIIDAQGAVAATGELGEIAVRRPDPVMFLEYWNKPEATRKKFSGRWMRTGDFGTKDERGHFWFAGRRDDLIESGGYRIGPGEVEDCLMTHQAVAMAGVLGVPDKVRGEIVKAFIVLKPGFSADSRQKKTIQDYVKTRLEAHAYPRQIEFLRQMPMTKTGKILKEELRNRPSTGA